MKTGVTSKEMTRFRDSKDKSARLSREKAFRKIRTKRKTSVYSTTTRVLKMRKLSKKWVPVN